MSADGRGSVSYLISQLRDGHASAAEAELWNRYFARLARVARKHLSGKKAVAVDGDDVALSALNSFFGRIEAGQFPKLNDRTGLWPLLVKITARKAINALNREGAAKRTPDRLDDLASLEKIAGSEPSPSDAAEIADDLRQLFDVLSDDMLRNVAQLAFEGYTNVEIAKSLDISERTVFRKLDRIRSEWEEIVQQWGST
jgi:RNA polymerase sigma factor (sigma-70 family)